MNFESQDDNLWWDHLANDSIIHLQGASTLRMLKLNNSLAKEPKSTQDAIKRATWILDANHNFNPKPKSDLQPIIRDNCKHLSANHQNKFLQPFIKYELIFDSTLSDWKKNRSPFKLMKRTTHHGQAFPVPEIHKIEAARQFGQSTHLFIPIELFFCWIVIFIAVLDRWQSTDQFWLFRFFITPIFHQLISSCTFHNWPRAVSCTWHFGYLTNANKSGPSNK